MKTTILTLLIIVLLAGIGLLGYQYYFQEQVDRTTPNVDLAEVGDNEDQNEGEVQKEPAVCHKFYPGDHPLFPLVFRDNTVDTSTWKTYRSDTFGFEIQHPADWRVNFSSASSPFEPAQSGLLARLSFYPSAESEKQIDAFYMYARSLEEYILRTTNSEINIPGYVKRFYSLNNTIGVQVDSQARLPLPDDSGGGYTLEGGPCNTIVSFNLTDEFNNGKYTKELEQILLSFTLINNL